MDSQWCGSVGVGLLWPPGMNLLRQSPQTHCTLFRVQDESIFESSPQPAFGEWALPIIKHKAKFIISVKLKAKVLMNIKARVEILHC
jgi:hypothetical protein